MKKFKIGSFIIFLSLAIAFTVNPPFQDKSQNVSNDTLPQPKVVLQNPVEDLGIDPQNAILVDSFNKMNTKILSSLDTIRDVAQSKTIEEINLKKYHINDYVAPVAVLKIPFKDKTILAQYDSAAGYFITKEIIFKQ